MMLTPLIRRQLRVLLVIAIVSVGLTAVVYGRIPRMVGLGVYDVAVDFADASGLYPRAIVTYRGVQVGDVGAMDLTGSGVRATLVLDSGSKIPDDVVAELHSTSAIGEQYVELVPKGSRKHLADGAVIPRERTREMPQISPVLDRLNGLLAAVPREQTRRVLVQLDEGLGGAGDDIGGVLDGASELLTAAQADIEETTALIDHLQPVLDTQAARMGNTRDYAKALSQFTGQLVRSDDDIRTLLKTSPTDILDTRRLVRDARPTLPVLLENLTTNAEVLNTYLPNLRQTLVIYPPTVARLQSTVNPRAEHGDVQLDLRANLNDPPHCTKGYLATGERRSPSDWSVRKVDGTAHCRLPSGAESAVRGARNLPCPQDPGRRAALPAGCGLHFGGDARGLAGTPYDVATGRFIGPDGRTYTLSEPRQVEGEAGWTSLLLGPLGRR